MKEAVGSSGGKQGQEVFEEKQESINEKQAWKETVLLSGKLMVPWWMLFERKLDDNRLGCSSEMPLQDREFFTKETVIYYETFRPVVLIEVLSYLVRKFVSEVWHFHHADVCTAFLIEEKDGAFYVSWDNFV